MNLHELFFEIAPAMSVIFELGFIPTEDDIVELSPELLALYENKGGNVSGKLYTIKSRDTKITPPLNEVNLLTESDVQKLWKGVRSIKLHAKRGGCTSENDEDILLSAASVLPPVFSEKSRFAWKDTCKPE